MVGLHSSGSDSRYVLATQPHWPSSSLESEVGIPCMLSTTTCMFFKMCALLTHRCCHPWRWMTTWWTVPNLEYNARITVSRDNTSSSISFFSSSRVDIVTKSPPCLATCSFFSIRSFLAMRKRTLELVASTYTLVALAKVARSVCTSITITCSSTCVGDVWSSGVGTLWDYTNLWWDSSKDMLCTSASGWPPRISVPPWSFETCSSPGCIEVGELTTLWCGMRSVSCSNSYYSMSASNSSSAYSISWEKFCPCDGSSCSLDANCSYESTTCTGATSSVCTWCFPFYICFYCASFSFWRNSCSFRSCSLSSCNSFSASSILFFSLYLCAMCLSHYCLFA